MKNNILELYTAVQSEGSRLRPTVVVRTTGCTHRCYFGEGGWCDSWYTSVHPEKPLYNINDVIELYEKNPHIREMMLTGGSPTMHPKLISELIEFSSNEDIFITMETEGSHWYDELRGIDLLSISPKFSNSVPVIGSRTPKEKIVDEKFVKQHNKFRMNHEVFEKMFAEGMDYQLKPVWGGDRDTLIEIEAFVDRHVVPREKIYLMPAGDTREALIKTYPIVMEKCIEMGWNFTGRPHIIAYGDKREV